MGTFAEWQMVEAESGRRIQAGIGRIRADWRPFLGLVIAAPDRSVLLGWVQTRYGLEDDGAEIALDQKLNVLVPLLDK